MRLPAILALGTALAAACAYASVCTASSAANLTAPSSRQGWTLDHYVYDPSLKQDWAVLVDCNHPAAPARMMRASGIPHAVATYGSRRQPATPVTIRSGAVVEVTNSHSASARIRLSGAAMETAFNGQPIRVRLSSNGSMVHAVVRGPHSVELVSDAKPLWGEP